MKALLVLLPLAIVGAAACQTPRALSQFLVPYEHRIDLASFTVAPPWIVTRERMRDGAIVLRTADGGTIAVLAQRDSSIAAISTLGDDALSRGWEQILRGAARGAARTKQDNVRLVERKVLGTFHPTALYVYETDAQRFMMATIYTKGCLGIASYATSRAQPTLHSDGFDRLVKSFRFETVNAPDRPGCGADDAAPAVQTQEAPGFPTAVVVPIQIIEDAVLVPVTLNRAQGATFLLDTGAQYTVVTPALAGRLGLTVPADAPTKSLTVIGGQKITVPFVRLLLIELGSSRVENVDVGVHTVVPDAPMIDGLLGGDVLGRFTMTVDRAARQLRLEPASLR